ncbi:class II aldolase/adducin family protein [Streptomyces canus]|uniref:class II aldolase/adducin family protein n=1 Tax=Streptomyces canus TaxID=58343 RepID=UPI00278A1BB7|nr:class II aldolase/adducin family protein [Streptomyces canus]MDQ0765523.1 rhamnose utilization protein RhaD (predicted bifunctional aldolase and dehydrogenase) [Streptomyces canus]
MNVLSDPALVPESLVALTRRLGDPIADLAILAEGNTSTVLPDGRFVVKASGSRMDRASTDDFVVVEPEPLLKLMERPRASQDELSALLSASPAGRPGPARSASIETLVHLAAIAAGGAAWVGHTHPTAVVGMLSTEEAEELFSAPLFPDEAVVLGRPAWVPYLPPGLHLGRAALASIRRHIDTHGAPPRLVLLGNHGIVALGRTAEEVEAITAMCVKAARVRRIALGSGSLATLAVESAYALAARPDEDLRRRLLRGAGQ